MANYIYLGVFCNDSNYWKSTIDINYEWDFGSFLAGGSIRDVVKYFRYRDLDSIAVNYMLSKLSDDEKDFNTSLKGPSKIGYNCFVTRCSICGNLHSFSAERLLRSDSIICSECNKYLTQIKKCGSLSSNIVGIEKYWVYSENSKTPDKIVFNYSNRREGYVLICPDCGKTHIKEKGSIVSSKSILCKNCAMVRGFPKVDESCSLYYEYPVIAKMFDEASNGVSSKEVYPNSNKTYSFKCEKGHLFKSSPLQMTRPACLDSKFKGCPYCSGRVVSRELSFGVVSPKVASLWDYEKNNGVTPYDVSKNSGQKFWFKCKYGHSFLSSPNSLSKSDNSQYLGCKACRENLTEGFNDLVSIEPTIINYWDDKNVKKPNEVRYDPENKSKDLYWLHCDKGHLYQQSACKIIKGFDNGVKRCPVCSGQFLQSGVNDITSLRPDVVKYWDYEKNFLNPLDVTPNSHKWAWFKCVDCNKSFYISINNRSKSAGYCSSCASKFNQSLAEKELIDWLVSLGYNVKTDLRLGSHNYKYDIYIPEKNIAIEYNGVYYHSELKHDRYYHYNKYKCCRDKNISFMVVWEDDYKKNSDFIKKCILRKLGDSNEQRCNARDCTICICSKSEAYDFLSLNHIQGFVNMCSYVSLIDKRNTVLAVLAFTFADGVLTIKRYATSCILRGGFSKLLKYLEDYYKPIKVETFSDNGVSDGALYRNLGFVPVKDIPPDYSYVYQGSRRIHKFNMRKKNFEKNLNLFYDPNMTESQLAEYNGLYRIWDYGKVKWIKYLP